MRRKKIKVYLAGPMTGFPHYNYTKFDEVADDLRAKGFKVVNPADISRANLGQDWKFYMKMDIPQLLKCDIVYAMDGYQFSKGASLEVHIAQTLAMPVLSSKGYYLKIPDEVEGF